MHYKELQENQKHSIPQLPKKTLPTRRALKELQYEKDIVMKEAEKRGAVCMMDT